MQDIETRILNIDEVYPNSEQPRQHFDQDKLKELADSIKELGLLSPILVKPDGEGATTLREGYQIVHGERRWRACKLKMRVGDQKKTPYRQKGVFLSSAKVEMAQQFVWGFVASCLFLRRLERWPPYQNHR